MRSAEEKRREMLTAPVELLVCKMAVPTIITMMITAFYNMADTFFVGKLDTLSTASVGIALPLMNVVQSIGFLFGHGSGNYISGKLGEGDTHSAKRMSDTAVIMSFISGLILSAAGRIFLKPMTVLLGATPLLMESSCGYISVLLIGIPFVMTSFTMNNQLRFRGNAFYGMIGMASGSILNIILDPILIFGFDMGIKGAAYATIISQIISFIILLKMNGHIKAEKPAFSITSDIVSSIFRFGTPSLCRQSIMSIAAICLNNAAGLYGEAVIAAVSVVNKIVMMGGSVIIGFGQGFQPVCGFNKGAKKFDRIHRTFSFCIKASTIFLCCYGMFTFVFAEVLVRFFRNDPEVVEAGARLLRFQSVTTPVHGIIVMTNMLMQNMGKTLQASFLAIARQGLFFIPLLYLLTNSFGLTGLELTQSSADILTFIATVPMTLLIIKMLRKQMEEQT